MNIYIWSGFAAPASTSDSVVNRLNDEINKILGSPELRARWRDMDFEPMPMSPKEFTEFVREESQRWRKVVEVSGFKIED